MTQTFDISLGEAKFIPGGEVPALVVQIVNLLFRKRNLQATILRYDSARVVPFEITGRPETNELGDAVKLLKSLCTYQ